MNYLHPRRMSFSNLLNASVFEDNFMTAPVRRKRILWRLYHRNEWVVQRTNWVHVPAAPLEAPLQVEPERHPVDFQLFSASLNLVDVIGADGIVVVEPRGYDVVSAHILQVLPERSAYRLLDSYPTLVGCRREIDPSKVEGDV